MHGTRSQKNGYSLSIIVISPVSTASGIEIISSTIMASRVFNPPALSWAGYDEDDARVRICLLNAGSHPRPGLP